VSDPADVLAVEACIYAQFKTRDGEPYIIGFKTRVESPATRPAEVTITPLPGEGTVALDAGSEEYANVLAFIEGLRRVAMTIRYEPIKRQRKSA
jgi:hypothetical protein